MTHHTDAERAHALAEKHGATSYRNRADTSNPAFGFTLGQLEALISEVEQAARRAPVVPVPQVDAIGAALELESRAKLVESQTTERAMLHAANCLRLLAAAPQPPEADHIPDAGKMVAAPVQLPEPVAFALEWTFNGEERGMRLYDDETHCRFDAESDGGVCHPLYTEQQVRALLTASKVERKPLTDEAIRTLYGESDGHWQMVGPQVLCFARSIESVHGIQEQST